MTLDRRYRLRRLHRMDGDGLLSLVEDSAYATMGDSRSRRWICVLRRSRFGPLETDTKSAYSSFDTGFNMPNRLTGLHLHRKGLEWFRIPRQGGRSPYR